LYYLDVYSAEFSKGAYYRILAFATCAIIFFSKKSFFKKRSDYRYLYLSSNILVLLIPLSFIFSTMADRISAYFLPFALIILGSISEIYDKSYSKQIKYFLVFILFTHLFLWTNFSYQARYYVPFEMLDAPSDKINPYKYMIDKYCC
jgi:lipoprotein signal peptidase